MEPLDCGTHTGAQLNRRGMLTGVGGLAGLSWLTPLGELLARDAEENSAEHRAKSLIVLWMAGGPSQLDTFDPHPGKLIGGDVKAIKTALPGVQLADTFPLLAEQMASVSLIRSMTSKEGDHERGTYTIKTGYRPDPTAVHPSIGAILAHSLPEKVTVGGKTLKTDIPRHVSILPNQWPGRGGFLGDQYDAFKTFDPVNKVPDVTARVSPQRTASRFQSLDVLEGSFARGRLRQVEKSMHRNTVRRARTMMTSDQLGAFDVSEEPTELKSAYGDTPFGRGCLAARRLIEVGVRCVEVTLSGWDTHADNYEGQRTQSQILDPAFATLLTDLKQRDLLDETIVLCVGEFGRTPKINPVGGRDHWPHNFTLALAGGPLNAGVVIGESDPDGGKEVANPVQIGDVYATILTAFGLDSHRENISRTQRPIRLANGEPLAQLLSCS